ncbi:MAG: hypothetical protein WCT33_05285 [Patescibacteria group bacterium]|jgi:hypothetical protein
MNEVIKNIAYFTIGSGILAFLIKSITKHFLDKDFEKYKLELNQLLEENKIRFSKLHEERAEVIKNVYQKLDRSIDSTQSLINPVQWSGEKTSEEKKKIAVEYANDFIRYYSENKIFFSNETCQILDDITEQLKDTFKKYWAKELFEKSSSEGKNFGTRSIESWEQAWEKIKTNVPEAQSRLADDFRRILGVQ